MPRQGLSETRVICAATELIEQYGIADFSMRTLAEHLHVKTASLYNHISSMEALMIQVCACAMKRQSEQEMQSIAGKSGEDAILALAMTYRQFAKEHRHLYRLIMSMAASENECLRESSQCYVEPFLCVLKHTDFSETEKIHWQRVLRGIVHGFVSQEESGLFSHLPADVNDSFHMAIQCYIDGLNQAEKRRKQQ